MMCGIVGYIGNQDAKEILVRGLEKLEYRGYDSAGIAAVYRGCDVDKPRNLAKSVTME
jgi:glucosamine 6-phosphate synthetase-like amidotransferase/phosphosugar isomerase protein